MRHLWAVKLLFLATLEVAAQTASGPAPPPSTPAARATPPAATKISGTLECEKSARTSLDVADSPGHVLSIGRTPCRWTKPLVLGRLRTFKGESTSMRDEKGETALERGYHVGRTGGKGDIYYIRFDGQIRSAESFATTQGRWAFTGGTGEIEGLQGAGSYKGTYDDKGASKIEWEGEYRFREPSPERTP
jgi:hypothetical protein